MHCTPQDAAEQKKIDKAQKIAKADAIKAEADAKKKARVVVEMLSSPLLLFEAAVMNYKNDQTGGQDSYVADSSNLLLVKVKDWVAQAGAAMLGNGPMDKVWIMEEIKHAKSQMVANTRTA